VFGKPSRVVQFILLLVLLAFLAVSSAEAGALFVAGRWRLALPIGLMTLALFVAVAYVVAFQPMQAVLRREQELERLARTDELTGLQTRQQIFDRLSAELNRAIRNGEALSCALVDIDGLRQINEKFGQAAGDSVLRSVGAVIGESCRLYDTAGRYGGEEFLIVLPATEMDDAARVADRLRRRVEERQFACHGQGFTVTVSIGVTLADVLAGETADVLISRANKALERAKTDGRNRVSAVATLALVEQTTTRTPTPPPR